jgi:hypothetical protein
MSSVSLAWFWLKYSIFFFYCAFAMMDGKLRDFQFSVNSALELKI